jgi:cytochrome oxidase Cu insertion factor (SCO1/SenC/PrrC family)
MMKRAVALVLVFCSLLVSVRGQKISGKVNGKPAIADTIYFGFGNIDPKYYDAALAPAELKVDHYTVNNIAPYPEMYRIHFASDKNILAYRKGYYFIDAATTNIISNYASDNCSEVNGNTAEEYKNIFIPFVMAGMAYDCNSGDLAELFNDPSKKADSLLLLYVNRYPDSYVALWRLIERFSMWGQSVVRQQILAGFSGKIKSGKPWGLLNEDFINSKIKEGELFPAINLKDYNLAATHFVAPKAKYILVDFWFARCRPCLDTIPELKKLYTAYKEKGFEMVSISVDETKNVQLWQQRVKEHGLNWTQYLEENNFQHNELGIKAFPTFILLDEQGKVIQKDFDLHDLDKFLKENL